MMWRFEPRDHVLRKSILAVVFLSALVACGNKAEEPSLAKPDHPVTESGLLRLTPEELTRTAVEVTTVARGPLQVFRQFPATIQANHNELAEVTTLIRGRVVKVQVDVGTDVKAGALLALLHSTDLGLAEGAYLKAAARLHEAELAHQRAEDLQEQGAVSMAELQRREAALKTARADSREAKNHLELLGVPRHELTRLDREHTIKADVPLRAPFDGRVIMRNITRGEVVETQQKLFTVADLSDVWVVAHVPEKDVALIRKEQPVQVIAAAYPHGLFPGTVTYIGDLMDPSTRTLPVRITAPNPGTLLKPEMFAIVSIAAEANPDSLAVPLSAIQNGPAGKIVFIQRAPNEFEVRPVQVGEESGEMVVVLDGVQPGEVVVTKGSFALKSEMERHKIEPTP